MSIAQAMCTSFKSEILKEEHQMVTDTIKIALFTSSASLGAATTAYASSGINEVANGSGYATGGVTLSSKAVTISGVKACFDAADPSWTSATFTANGAMIYNSSNSNKAIAILAFGGDFTVSGGTFQIVFPAAGANSIIRID